MVVSLVGGKINKETSLEAIEVLAVIGCAIIIVVIVSGGQLFRIGFVCHKLSNDVHGDGRPNHKVMIVLVSVQTK